MKNKNTKPKKNKNTKPKSLLYVVSTSTLHYNICRTIYGITTSYDLAKKMETAVLEERQEVYGSTYPRYMIDLQAVELQGGGEIKDKTVYVSDSYVALKIASAETNECPYPHKLDHCCYDLEDCMYRESCAYSYGERISKLL